mgnify:CR=1 FL=1
MVVADLHVHTPNSDGTLTLDRVPTVARAAGLEAVAITDHDRTHPDLDAPVSTRDGVDVIHGIELRVEAGPDADEVVLDLGTGTGMLALAAALRGPARVIGVELDRDELAPLDA